MTIRHPVIIFLLSTLLLSGCGGSDNLEDLQEYMIKLKQAKTKELILLQKNPPKVKLAFPASTAYKAQTFREPFGAEMVAADKGVGPLQGTPLNMLRFVGTISQAGVTTAYILTPDNMIFQVKKGDMIGQRYGKIINISPYEVTVLEQEVNNGQASSNVVALQLRETR